ncbi:MAG TPA: chemotaxis response regulator protein-glutamate methylesterase [Caulobacteraceae bacterium]|nr:chemotaxis response regulator protein-glutamate methylesterase [Caulobacteraceae bacterium]
MSTPIRVLIVDDSATMRSLIAAILKSDPDIAVCGQASDPLEARQMIKELNPDVITLDVEMPNMTGIDFLERIMRLRPTPVIMCSTLTQRGAEITLEALELGAVDCVGKPVDGLDQADDFAQLPAKVKIAAKAKLGGAAANRPAPQGVLSYEGRRRVIAIGSSTGGVEALGAIIPVLPVNCPPVVITQHMPPAFTASLAARLNKLSAIEVSEAQDGVTLAPGHAYIAPGGARHLAVAHASGGLQCRLLDSPPVNGHRPSVDVLFHSVATSVGREAIGVILTGMGRDGAQGLAAMREAGAATLGQDEATSVVYGMPRVAFELNAVERQAPIYDMAAAIMATDAASARAPALTRGVH